MGFNGNKSDVKTGNSKTLYSGLAEAEVVAINPTAEEMKSILGFENVESAPNYVSDRKDKEGNEFKNAKIDFWLKLENGSLTKMTIFVDGVIFSSTTGKTQCINQYGRTAWLSDMSENPYSWFNMDGIRACYRGEEDLHKFLSAWLNVIYTRDKKQDCQLENPEAMFKGDFSELKGILKDFPGNKVRVLLGVRETEDGKRFQAVYTKYFGKVCLDADPSKFVSAMNEPYGEFKADLQDYSDLSLVPYTKVAEKSISEVEESDDDLDF